MLPTQTITFENKKITLTVRDDADQSVIAEIFKLREYRRAEEKIRSATSAIIDVGAHAGFFSLYTRALNSTVPIFALEPEPNNLIGLQKNISQNEAAGITVVPKALTSATGRVDLIITNDNHNHYVARPFKDDGKKIRVASTSLADLCTNHAIEKINLLKMDIEGGEYLVFDTLQAADFAKIEAVILEYHNTKSKNYKSIEQNLREHGFSVEIFPSKFDKTMGFLWALNKKQKSS